MTSSEAIIEVLTGSNTHGVSDVDPALLTTRGAAELLACSSSTIRRLVSEEVVRPVRLRDAPGAGLRFRVRDLERLVGDERREESSS